MNHKLLIQFIKADLSRDELTFYESLIQELKKSKLVNLFDIEPEDEETVARPQFNITKPEDLPELYDEETVAVNPFKALEIFNVEPVPEPEDYPPIKLPPSFYLRRTESGPY